ncbi:hypothetical protein OOT46_05430 [Aquabacterium sp. A7-Y]|uniref:hypothetical protein n=1 Tax=Aquabacterium sp. A7-Y TaxID=1349605 RepID=UPI00223CB6FD|nr:hypothetical protein [Aquabacterium sp. A7-Y]MCW7537292.1 hypothetical protein [Aquabacterium sp. A7-Y]
MSYLPGRRLRASQLPLAAACALVVQAAPALADPYYLQASQEFSRESNLFRDRDGAERSDTISSSTLQVGVDQPIGRQRLVGSAMVQRNLYKDQSHLNNTAYGVNVRADLETVNRISGGLRYSNSRRLAEFETGSATTRNTERNLLTLQEFGARGQLGMASLWVLETGYTFRDQDYSAKAFESLVQKSHAVNFGTKYRPSDLINFGLGYRQTAGRIPNYRPGIEDEYDRKDIDFTVLWKPNGLSTLDMRLSRTHTDHDVVDAKDFKGFTGNIGYSYRPGGKLSYKLNLIRETNDDTSLLDFGEFAGIDLGSQPLENTRTITSLRFGTVYDATAKIRLTGGLRYIRRNIEETGLVNRNGSDRTTVATLGANYAFSRNWTFGCNVAWEKRKADESEGVSFPFKAETASCMAQFLLQ